MLVYEFDTLISYHLVCLVYVSAFFVDCLGMHLSTGASL